MSDIGYIKWGLIPLEEDVKTGNPTTMHPPMLGNLALDLGASIFLELEKHPLNMQIEIATTAVSAPTIDPPFTLYTGDKADEFKKVNAAWHSQYDGPTALFNSEINALGPYFKIHNEHPKSVVVTSVTFNGATVP
mgnify:FL=1